MNLLLRCAGVVLMVSAAAGQQAHSTWNDYLGGSDSAHYSALKQINRTNIDKLEVAWTYATGDDGAYAFSPIVVDNVLYVLAKNGSLVALDAATAKEIWVHQFEPARDVPGGRGTGGRARGNRGINYWESKDRSDRRLLIAVNNYLEAIDARAGNLIDSFGDHGRIDLREGLGRDPSSVRHIQSNTPGRVFENLIILGSSTGEEYISPPGDLRAYDIRTGKMAWIFHTVPHPGEFGYDTWPKNAWKYIGGTNAWGEITLDEKRGIAYFPLGSPTYDFYGADREGANLFSDCLLALDARTGKYLWHYQFVHHDLWDYDATTAPQLVTVKHGGKIVDAVAEATKQGFLYVFDRVTGKPFWPIVERRVPQTTVPGEQSWPTQPFPAAPPPFARQKFTADDLDTFFLTPEERAKWKDRLLSARNEGLFSPPALDKETVYMPGHNGGANIFGSASDPTDGTVYVVTKNTPVLVKLGNRPSGGGANAKTATPAQFGRAVYQRNCQTCHGIDLKGGLGPSLEGVVERRGRENALALIDQGQGEMPPFGSLPDAALNALLVFLTDPAAAPAETQPQIAAPTAELPYPRGLDVPKIRYYLHGGLAPTAISPPWSTLTAYDLNTGTIKWQAPYGDAPQAGPSDTERGNLFQRSGIVATAGGIILFASNEGKLRILDKDSGKEICAINLPRGSEGVPAVYEADGREYVVVNATGAFAGWGSDGPPAKNVESQGHEPGAYVAFALPSSLRTRSSGVGVSTVTRAADEDFNGRWDLEVHSKPANILSTTTKAWWLGITGAGTPDMKIQFVGSPDGSLDDITEAKLQDGVLHFAWQKRTNRIEYEVKYVKGVLEGKMTGPKETLMFTGHRAPKIDEHDDGTWVEGKPVRLFNGKDLTGWTGVASEKAQGWTVEDGILKGTGHADDLVTVAKYWNFKLHAEFKLAEGSNSGIGLRGRYEVQIASDYGRPPGMHGTGALYTRILPRVNASKPPDEWQTYDIRLVGRDVSATLNGETLYEKGVIDGLTGIAYDPFEDKPGSIELQGDHGPVEFRNLVLAPLTQRKDKVNIR